MHIKIISLGRASYRKITLTPLFEINPKLIIFEDYFFSLISCLLFSIFNFKKNIEIIFCDGCDNTWNSKIIKLFFNNKKISFLWLNGINEINNGKSFNNKNYYFFPEQQKFINKEIYPIVPVPNRINSKKNKNTFLISYISEVIINIEDNSYLKINKQKIIIKNKIDQFVWNQLKKNNYEKISNLNFSFNFINELIKKDTYQNKLILSNEIYRLFKHRMRYMIVSKLYKHFKERVCLIGETWEKLGFKTLRNNYDYHNNRKIYENSAFGLDCGSTSAEYPIYLRVYEIIINSACLFQSKTSFSKKIFGNLENKICFSNLNDMIKKLYFLKNLSDDDLYKIKKVVLARMKKQNHKSL